MDYSVTYVNAQGVAGLFHIRATDNDDALRQVLGWERAFSGGVVALLVINTKNAALIRSVGFCAHPDGQ